MFCNFKIFNIHAENEANVSIKILRSNGGREYFYNEMSSFLYDCAIHRQFTCKYAHKQSGVAESKNRVIVR